MMFSSPKLEMVDIYKDIDDEEEIGKYFADGEIVGPKFVYVPLSTAIT